MAVIFQEIGLNFGNFSVLLFIITEVIKSIPFPKAELKQEICCTNALYSESLNQQLL